MPQDEDTPWELKDLEQPVTNFEDSTGNESVFNPAAWTEYQANENKSDGYASDGSDSDSMSSEEERQLWADLHINSAPYTVGFSSHGTDVSNVTIGRPPAEAPTYPDQEEGLVSISGVQFSTHTEHNFVVNNSSGHLMNLYNTNLLVMAHDIPEGGQNSETEEHPAPTTKERDADTVKDLDEVAEALNVTSSTTPASKQICQQVMPEPIPSIPTLFPPSDSDRCAWKDLGLTPEEIDAARQNFVFHMTEAKLESKPGETVLSSVKNEK